MASIPIATTATKIKAPATTLSSVQIATDGESYGSHGEQKHPHQHAPQHNTYEETSREQQTRSCAQARLYPPWSMSFFKLWHTPLPTQRGLYSNHSAATPLGRRK